ncbi:MAG: exodeoxyribonuclease VII small subunit [Betaproteobacteria bacterium]|nr:exodeoxyribonuclease VII small subunit [Betaproteobacteria bacterium]
MSIPDDIRALGFEQALAALEQETQRLESGQLSLADSLAAYQRGAALLRHAQALLLAVQQEIEVIDEEGQRVMARADFTADNGR